MDRHKVRHSVAPRIVPTRVIQRQSFYLPLQCRNLLSPDEASADRMLPFTNSLVAELCADRQVLDTFKQPIIFICHGFGSSLVK